MEEETTRVEIADHTGHTIAQMSRGQVMDLINGSEGWVYAGGRRVGQIIWPYPTGPLWGPSA